MSQKMIEFMKVLRMDKLSSERRNKTVLRISSLRGQGRFHFAMVISIWKEATVSD